ncbi:MAG TPA: DUF3179 domain-containing (seleno)protein [Tepidisphaeraceae bacterium]
MGLLRDRDQLVDSDLMPAESAGRITLRFSSRASILTLGPAPREMYGQPLLRSPGSHRADAGYIVKPVVRFLVTLLLATLALASATVVAFGTHPALAKYPSGLDWIVLARRVQWPMLTLSLALCLTLIGMVTAGRRSAFWLLVLMPVLFLMYQRFAGGPVRRMAILDNPPFVGMEKATHLKNDAQVIGLVLDGQPYAYPTGALTLAPVVVHAEADKRLIVMYSPYAGRAQAFVVDNTIKPREMDIVSMPADALLLYNSRIGQFINAFTGTTLNGERPDGFTKAIETHRLSWREWRTQYPDTQVLATALAPAERIQPHFPLRPVKMDLPAETKVALLGTPQPVVVQISKIARDGEPLNLVAGGANLLVFRERGAGRVRVFNRAVSGDLFPRFKRKAISAKPEVAFTDADTGSLWTWDGHCVDGYAKGEVLKSVSVEEDLPYGTLKSYAAGLGVLKIP